MELMQDVKGYSEEEEEEELAADQSIRREESSRLHQPQDAGASNFINHRKPQQLDLMELSLGSNNREDIEANLQGSSSNSTNVNKEGHIVEKEHMFDKVVTPSDVGKLNRLVIPKQHAEKYFPLDSSSNEKGLLLNFEDRNGKPWRFRYSYWNSSQSYVMTKGWSRFVKDKKLDAGDIVSFQRGLADSHRHRLYIDFRRRAHHVHVHPSPTTPFITPSFLPTNHPPHYSITWPTASTARLYSLPSPNTPSANCNMYTFHQQNRDGVISNNNLYNDMNSGSGSSIYFLRSMADQQQRERGDINIVAPMIIDSVPVAHHHHRHRHFGDKISEGGASGGTNTAGKRLRLFGVNMECASNSSSPAEESSIHRVTMANSVPISSLPQRVPQPYEDPGEHRGATSVFFDLDPSFRCRQ